MITNFKIYETNSSKYLLKFFRMSDYTHFIIYLNSTNYGGISFNHNYTDRYFYTDQVSVFSYPIDELPSQPLNVYEFENKYGSDDCYYLYLNAKKNLNENRQKKNIELLIGELMKLDSVREKIEIKKYNL